MVGIDTLQWKRKTKGAIDSLPEWNGQAVDWLADSIKGSQKEEGIVEWKRAFPFSPLLNPPLILSF